LKKPSKDGFSIDFKRSPTRLTWFLPPHSPAGTFAHRLLSPTTGSLAFRGRSYF